MQTAEQDSNRLCPRCGCVLFEGVALTNTYVSANDFGNDAGSDGCTMSLSGNAKMIGCRKCPQCGYSETTINLNRP